MRSTRHAMILAAVGLLVSTVTYADDIILTGTAPTMTPPLVLGAPLHRTTGMLPDITKQPPPQSALQREQAMRAAAMASTRTLAQQRTQQMALSPAQRTDAIRASEATERAQQQRLMTMTPAQREAYNRSAVQNPALSCTGNVAASTSGAAVSAPCGH